MDREDDDDARTRLVDSFDFAMHFCRGNFEHYLPRNSRGVFMLEENSPTSLARSSFASVGGILQMKELRHMDFFRRIATMRGKGFVSMFCAFILCLTHVFVWAEPSQFPENSTFTTLITTPRAVEGLTGDGVNNLYIGGSGNAPCPIWQINLHNPTLTVVGNVTPPGGGTCAFSGIAFDAAAVSYTHLTLPTSDLV